MIVKPDIDKMIKEGWGMSPPSWIEALGEACDASSQTKVAGSLGMSPSVIGQTLRNQYPGRVDRVEEAVRGALMHETVTCPAFGPLEMHICQQWRKRSKAFSPHNPQRVRMFHACRTCKHNEFREGDDV